MMVRWLTGFLDLPGTTYDETTAFWAQVTGFRVSASRGDREEFASLLPAAGDNYLRVQRIDEAGARIHLDLHVADPRAAADRAVELGAVEHADLGYVVLRSPGGLWFCLVSHGAGHAPAPTIWPSGHVSRVYQVSIDIPADDWDREVEFWSRLLGGAAETMSRRPEYAFLPPVPGAALTLLLQRLDEPTGTVRGHLDVGTDDRAAETKRHVGLGAEVVVEEEFWTVLRDPAGSAYCITDRDPRTGQLSR